MPVVIQRLQICFGTVALVLSVFHGNAAPATNTFPMVFDPTDPECRAPSSRATLMAAAGRGPAMLIPSIPGARRLSPDATTGSAKAVIIGDHPLVHTTQLFPVNEKGAVEAKDVAGQTEAAFAVLGRTLREAGSSFLQTVKLNVYVTRDDSVPAVQSVLARYFMGDAKPAVCFVTTALPVPGALVAVDAVAVNLRADAPADVRLFPRGKSAASAILPRGSSVYVSGQAEKGSLAEATRKTLESLLATLQHQKLGREHIVQLKAFLTPMSDLAVAEAEFSKFFGEGTVPPLVWVEWVGNSPIEIELIAAADKPADGGSVTYSTPPGMKASPIYSRVAQINGGKRIYLSGLHGSAAQNGETQVKEIFATLDGLLKQSGSDLKHLVKATYYVSDNDASAKLNELRPGYYDPQRSPAASKAMVKGVAAPGRSITVDMIAATVE